MEKPDWVFRRLNSGGAPRLHLDFASLVNRLKNYVFSFFFLAAGNNTLFKIRR